MAWKKEGQLALPDGAASVLVLVPPAASSASSASAEWTVALEVASTSQEEPKCRALQAWHIPATEQLEEAKAAKVLCRILSLSVAAGRQDLVDLFPAIGSSWNVCLEVSLFCSEISAVSRLVDLSDSSIRVGGPSMIGHRDLDAGPQLCEHKSGLLQTANVADRLGNGRQYVSSIVCIRHTSKVFCPTLLSRSWR